MEQRRKYDREFKAQAVQLCEQQGVTITQIARELGINVNCSTGGVRKQRMMVKLPFPGLSQPEFHDKIKQLWDIGFWEDVKRWDDVARSLPNYRLSKLQPLMPS